MPNRSDLATLRAAADAACAAFDTACRGSFADRRWGYYRAVEGDGRGVTDAMHAAADAYLAALHTFYLARDGERGFLGARGL